MRKEKGQGSLSNRSASPFLKERLFPKPTPFPTTYRIGSLAERP